MKTFKEYLTTNHEITFREIINELTDVEIEERVQDYIQQEVKFLNIPGVVWRSEQLVCDLYDDLGCAISGKNNENCVRCKYSRKAN